MGGWGERQKSVGKGGCCVVFSIIWRLFDGNGVCLIQDCDHTDAEGEGGGGRATFLLREGTETDFTVAVLCQTVNMQ